MENGKKKVRSCDNEVWLVRVRRGRLLAVAFPKTSAVGEGRGGGIHSILLRLWGSARKRKHENKLIGGIK